ncbi:GNAT family protein [Nonomuraea angiospora]|uniref:GNAT family N-acetyltransferase n=1 Tax=Nonomuraea angiospora TaxID=46172 RepID=UPI0034248E84
MRHTTARPRARQREERADWYRIRNAAGDDGGPAEVYIYDEISWWGVSAQDFISELNAAQGREAGGGFAELDIQLGEKDVWGRGYAAEAMRLMCRYGFNEMRVHRITLDVAAENTAARRVYERVSFVEEGRVRECFRHDGKRHDMILMGLLKDELRD